MAAQADGLSGALIVKAAAPAVEPFTYDSEYLMYLSDWYHTNGAQQYIQLNRCALPREQAAWKPKQAASQ